MKKVRLPVLLSVNLVKNPARDLGPRIAHAVLPIKWKGESDWSYAWVPIVGPLIGGGLSFLIAKLIGIL